MSSASMRRPLNWLGLAAFAAAFWITLRVVAAVPPPPAAPAIPFTPASGEAIDRFTEIPDPALERLVARLSHGNDARNN